VNFLCQPRSILNEVDHDIWPTGLGRDRNTRRCRDFAHLGLGCTPSDFFEPLDINTYRFDPPGGRNCPCCYSGRSNELKSPVLYRALRQALPLDNDRFPVAIRSGCRRGGRCKIYTQAYDDQHSSPSRIENGPKPDHGSLFHGHLITVGSTPEGEKAHLRAIIYRSQEQTMSKLKAWKGPSKR